MTIRRINVAVKTGSPTDTNAWWNLPANRDEAATYPIVLPPDVTWIALDPGTCSPFVTVAVDLPDTGRMLLTPGAPLPVPKGGARILMWNPAVVDVAAYNQGGTVVTGITGRIVLLGGSDASLGHFLAYANRMTLAGPKLSPIITFLGAVNDMFRFPAMNLRALRIIAQGATAGGPAVPQVADFSVTLRPIHRSTLSWESSDSLDRVPSNLATAGRLDAAQPVGDALTLASDAGVGTWAIAKTVPIITPAWSIGYLITTLAGTGITRAQLTVEGY
jgi:hypothetical protein